ncbi:MAG TPA: hypothetical protein VEV43_13190 [Actinomycetota bacterium]|nr:hypothetical protein [Actinomycetota bacterium]
MNALLRLHETVDGTRSWDRLPGYMKAGTHREEVIKKQTYAGKRIRQGCRWISTTAYLALRASGLTEDRIVEVQATIYPPDDPEHATLYISANTKTAIAALEKLFASGTAGAALDAMIALAQTMSGTEQNSLGDRVTRHPSKLQGLSARNDPADPDAHAWRVLQAALKRRAVVARRASDDDGPSGADPHAELNLRDEINVRQERTDIELDPAHVGGLRRPCVQCHEKLYRHAGASPTRPGRLWLTQAASVGIKALGSTPDEIALHIFKNVHTTYLTYREGGKPTDRVNTSSSSEAEPVPTIARPYSGPAEPWNMPFRDETAPPAPVPPLQERFVEEDPGYWADSDQ